MSDLPQITVSSLDHDRLTTLLDQTDFDQFPAAELLQQELDRADVLEPEQMPANVLTMNSTATVQTDGGQERLLTLVYPKDADFGNGKISILAGVGAAMLGLSIGQSIGWTQDGKTTHLTLVALSYQPEAAGELFR
ncbi:MAG: nucleoside diphosphate kinase regulator [Neisseriaceae bacterium]|nr:nucleoside diphosphate kinase regulator [Neisseriaceae bacterium]MBP6862782.1 nucleoside diphosphate kinase regulator [Neisseriaceae bacterium]